MREDLSKRKVSAVIFGCSSCGLTWPLKLYQGNELLAECINDSDSKSVELRCYDPNLGSSSLLYPCLIYAFLVCSGRVDNINDAEIPPVPEPVEVIRPGHNASRASDQQTPQLGSAC